MMTDDRASLEGELLPCPFCGSALTMRRSVNPYGRCMTPDCFGNRCPTVSLDNLEAVAQWNARTPEPSARDGFFVRVSETVRESNGLWWTCTGCHESEDGHDVGRYPLSPEFGCKLGAGCRECGGIGAIWDTADWNEAARAMMTDTTAPAPSGTIAGECDKIEQYIADYHAAKYPSDAWVPNLTNMIACRLSDIRGALVAVAEPSARDEALRQIVELEPKPFDLPADWEDQIANCAECKRYEGHPIQQGICDTHRRPLWDREKHRDHEESAIGGRAKMIARQALEATPSPPSAAVLDEREACAAICDGYANVHDSKIRGTAANLGAAIRARSISEEI